MTPYPSFTDLDRSRHLNPHPSHLPTRRPNRPQSPTLDFTLFFTVRALDTLIRAIYDNLSPNSFKFISKCSDVLLFQSSCWRIMWCWFYEPGRLPSSYVKWITSLAEMDPRLLRIIRWARQGRFRYGSPAEDDEIRTLSRSIAIDLGRAPEQSDPEFITRLSCAIIHGKLGNSESCTLNLIRRFLTAWKTSFGIYLPVFTVPVLLFQRNKLTHQPSETIARVILQSSRSAGFLASFIGLTWFGVCLGRSKLVYDLVNTWLSIGRATGNQAGSVKLRPPQPPRLLTITDLDSRIAPQLGSLLAGLSILIENKKRRGEMALYVATRALCATIDEILPAWLRSRIKKNRWVSIWVERITFSISIGIITCAVVHHPDYVRGIVQGILKYAIGPDWPKDGHPKSIDLDPRSPSHHPSTSSETQHLSSSPSIEHPSSPSSKEKTRDPRKSNHF